MTKDGILYKARNDEDYRCTQEFFNALADMAESLTGKDFMEIFSYLPEYQDREYILFIQNFADLLELCQETLCAYGYELLLYPVNNKVQICKMADMFDLLDTSWCCPLDISLLHSELAEYRCL